MILLWTGLAQATCSHADLAALSAAELRVRRNEVFARHGRSFSSADLASHFAAQDWYRADPDYDDARLSDADRACVARVNLHEQPPLWQGEADLDGDGKPDALKVLATDARLGSKDDSACEEGCTATVVVGGHHVDVLFHWTTGAYFGTKTAKVVDIDPSDARKELLIEHRRQDWEDPPYLTDVFVLTSEALNAQRFHGEGYDSGRLEIPGDGRLIQVDDVCPHTDRTTWKLVDWQLVKQGTERTTNPGASHPDFVCAG